MPRYSLLKRQHAEYDAELYNELELLYEGGYAIIRQAATILRRGVDEPPALHKERCENASYIPYLGQIVDQLTSWLFTDPLQIVPAADAENPDTPGELPDAAFYGMFASDADRAGTSFADMLRQSVSCALLKRRAIIGVDCPKVDPETAETFRSAADEKSAGADRAYLYDVPVEQLINWGKNADKSFAWAVINTLSQPQAGPLEPSDTIVEEFKCWTMTAAGTAHWDLYRIEYAPDKPPADDADVLLADEGETRFRSIPLAQVELPKGLWVGNKIGPLAREHFRERSRLMSSEAKSLDEIPLIQLGPEIGAIGGAVPSERQENPGRGDETAAGWKRRGYAVLGTGDSMKFIGPSGVAFALKNQQLGELKDEIFRVVHLMAASVSNNKSAALGRSGLAKQEDKNDTAIVLEAVGAFFRKLGLDLHALVSEARTDKVVWQAKGLANYESIDREQLLAEAMAVDTIDIPSPTWKIAYKSQIAMLLAEGLPPETQAAIRAEIVEGVGHEEDLRCLMRDARVDRIKNPPPPPPVGVPDVDGDEGQPADPAEARQGAASKPNRRPS